MTSAQIINRLIKAETVDLADDSIAQRMVREERMKLESTVTSPPDQLRIDKPTAIRRQMDEAIRVARMYGVEIG